VKFYYITHHTVPHAAIVVAPSEEDALWMHFDWHAWDESPDRVTVEVMGDAPDDCEPLIMEATEVQ
jgi:hypothetical protein